MASNDRRPYAPEVQITEPFVYHSPTEYHSGYTPVEKDPKASFRQVETDGTFATTASRSRSIPSLWKQWRWEFLCWAFGTACVFGMVGVLVYFRNRPVEQWHFRIQISAVISALSQGAQSSLMVGVSACIGQLKWPYLEKSRRTVDIRRFDDASRGPEGSFMLIVKTAFKPGSVLVALGALITILFLAFGTFAQQTVGNDIRETAVNSAVASISFATSYARAEAANPFFTDNSAINGVALSSEDLYISRSIISGLSTDNNSPSDITPDCLTEHCTWPHYNTLAICMTAEDVTSKIVDRTNGTAYNDTEFSVEGLGIDIPTVQGYKTFWIGAAYYSSKDLPAPQKGPSTLNSIADVYTVYLNPCDDKNQTRKGADFDPEFKDIKNWKAHKASFRLCVQEMVSEYNITMNTTVVKQEMDIQWEGSSSDTDTTSQYNWCAPNSGNTNSTNKSDLCIKNGTLIGIGGEMISAFTGAASMVSGGDSYIDGQWTPNFVTDILGSNPSDCDPDQYFTKLGFTGFKNRMENVAVSLTNAMRVANGTSANATGVVWQRQPFITVEFYWFSLPGALWLMATFFFFATVVVSRRSDLPIWKSSPLVLLHAKDGRNTMGSFVDVDRQARSTSVELRHKGDGWCLRETTGTGHGQIQGVESYRM